MGKLLQLKGRHFGKLLVRDFAGVVNHKGTWHVECDCGWTGVMDAHHLKRGLATQCNGCRLQQLWNGNKKADAAFNHLLALYRNQAKRAKRDFKLTKKQFLTLTSLPCFYTGRQPSQVIKSRGGSVYTYNGIDRRDNGKGYTLKNSVSCDGVINQMKGTLTDEEFIGACKEVAKHHGN